VHLTARAFHYARGTMTFWRDRYGYECRPHAKVAGPKKRLPGVRVF
jgi:hypothetical protein